MVGRVSESVNRPLEYCDKFIGFSPDTWIDSVLWHEEVFQAVEDANNKSSNPVKLIKPVFEKPEEITRLSGE